MRRQVLAVMGTVFACTHSVVWVWVWVCVNVVALYMLFIFAVALLDVLVL